MKRLPIPPDPPPRDDPKYEPSHPWAHHDREFDWDRERERQHREGVFWVEAEDERIEREVSILPPPRSSDDPPA